MTVTKRYTSERYAFFRAQSPKDLALQANTWRQENEDCQVLREHLCGSPFGVEFIVVYIREAN